MEDNTAQVSDQINNAVNSALGVGALAAIYTGNFVNFGKEGGETLALITKTITENGTYNAVDDGADGYSSVTVAVPPTSAFVIAGFSEGETVTATKGDITIISDTSGNYLFALPATGEWTFTSTDGGIKTVDVTEGSSTSIFVGLVQIVSTYALESYSIEKIGDNAYNLLFTSNQNAGGIVLNFPDVTTVRTSIIEATGYKQYGVCTSGATFPTVVTSGSGRGQYATENADMTFTSTYPNYFIGANNARIKVTITVIA